MQIVWHNCADQCSCLIFSHTPAVWLLLSHDHLYCESPNKLMCPWFSQCDHILSYWQLMCDCIQWTISDNTHWNNIGYLWQGTLSTFPPITVARTYYMIGIDIQPKEKISYQVWWKSSKVTFLFCFYLHLPVRYWRYT